MEELYRRVSDRQTMGSVVQELRASLSEAEKLIDQFFRNPAERAVLIPVPAQLCGDARRAVGAGHGPGLGRRCCACATRSTAWLDRGRPEKRARQAGVFDRLAGNLGALGFLIDMLSVQPQLAKSLFVFDADDGHAEPGDGPARDAAQPAAPRPRRSSRA